MDREAWCAAIHGVTESDTTEWLNWSQLNVKMYVYICIYVYMCVCIYIYIYIYAWHTSNKIGAIFLKIYLYIICTCMLSHFSHVQMFVTLWTVAFQALRCGILQARILEWVSIPYFSRSSQCRHQACISWVLQWQAGSLLLVPNIL